MKRISLQFLLILFLSNSIFARMEKCERNFIIYFDVSGSTFHGTNPPIINIIGFLFFISSEKSFA